MATVVGLMGTSGTAVAQPTEAVSARDRARAKELTERAIQSARTGDYETAIDLYLRAYELSREAILLSNIGAAYQAQGASAQALPYFCRYLEADPQGKLATFAREQAEALAVELERSPACGKPRFAPRADAARVLDDGGVAATGTGAPTSKRTADAADDRDDGDEPGEPAPAIRLDASSSERSSGAAGVMRVAGWSLGIGGIAALGAGGYYGWVGKRASDVINGNRDAWTADELEQERIGEQANTRMKVFLIAGGAATATAVALLLWSRSLRREASSVSLVPTLDPTSQGLAVVGVLD